MTHDRERIPDTTVSGVAVAGLIGILGGSVLGAIRIGLGWAIAFAVLVVAVGLAVDRYRPRRATSEAPERGDRPGQTI